MSQEQLLITLLEIRDYAHLQADKVSNGFIAREKWHNLEEKIKRVVEGENYVPETEVWEACRQEIKDKEWPQ